MGLVVMSTFVELLGGTRSVPVDEQVNSPGGLLTGLRELGGVAVRLSPPFPVCEAALAHAWLPHHQRDQRNGEECKDSL